MWRSGELEEKQKSMGLSRRLLGRRSWEGELLVDLREVNSLPHSNRGAWQIWALFQGNHTPPAWRPSPPLGPWHQTWTCYTRGRPVRSPHLGPLHHGQLHYLPYFYHMGKGRKSNGVRNESEILKLDYTSKPESNQKVMESVQDVNLEFNRAQLKITIGKK